MQNQPEKKLPVNLGTGGASTRYGASMHKRCTGAKPWELVYDANFPGNRYETKKAALLDLEIGNALVMAMRAAIAPPQPTELEYACLDAQHEVKRCRAELEKRLQRLARQATEDAERTAAGSMPYGSSGQYVRTAVEIDTAHTELDSACKHFATLAYLAQEAGARVAIGYAIGKFFCAGLRR